MRLKKKQDFKLKHNIGFYIFLTLFLAALLGLSVSMQDQWKDRQALEEQQKMLEEYKNGAKVETETVNWEQEERKKMKLACAGTAKALAETLWKAYAENGFRNWKGLTVPKATEIAYEPKMLPEYAQLYEENDEFIGWLSIDGTVIDYPVMQCPEDENYYLTRGFYKEENSNGSLILDNDSVAGIGIAKNAYQDGINPSTNLIIHGHTMKSGAMFGRLDLYAEEDYGKEHRIICFDSLYEKREYELIAVFYSQVFYKSQDVFKFYKFFQADTQEEFDDWYENIKKMSLYDTGVTAELGDEFITLSCCAYHVEDGRFVVVGKRIK